MLIVNLLLFLLALAVLIKSSEYATKYSHRLAILFRLPEFLISFLIVAVISCFPEATVSILSALEGTPEFGLGTLLGSNVADLTLVFGIIALASYNGLHIKSTVIKKDLIYLLLLLVPVLLGIDGEYTRIDGIMLVLIGGFFFFSISMHTHVIKQHDSERPSQRAILENLALLVLSLSLLMIGAYFTIDFGFISIDYLYFGGQRFDNWGYIYVPFSSPHRQTASLIEIIGPELENASVNDSIQIEVADHKIEYVTPDQKAAASSIQAPYFDHMKYKEKLLTHS